MEDINVKEIFEIFWRKRIIIILILLVCLGLGYVYSKYIIIPKYKASTTLVLTKADDNQKNIETNSITTTDLTLNSKLVSTYSELIKSKNILGEVISNLKINYTEDELKKKINVSSVEDTELIQISVSENSPEQAAQIANEIANVFKNKIKEIYKINNVYIVDMAEIPEKPYNMNTIKNLSLFVFLGVVISILYIIIINMFDTTVKTPEDVEKNTGLNVLAQVPEIKIGGKK